MNGQFGGIHGGKAVSVFAHKFCDIGKFFWVSDQVIARHVRQQYGIRHAVRHVVQTAKLMRHRVNVAKVGVVKGHAGQQRGVGHVFACFQVAAQRYGLAQVTRDETNSLDSGGVGNWVGIFGNIGFHGVGQGVHPGRCGQRGGFAEHQQRIVNGDRRQVAPADNHKLHFGFGIGQHTVAGDLAGGTGSGIHRDDRRQWIGQSFNPGIAIEIAFVGRRDTDAFTAVMWTTAADGNDDIAMLFAKDVQTVTHVGIFGIRFNAVKNHHLNTGLTQMGEGFIYCTVFNSPQTFISNQ